MVEQALTKPQSDARIAAALGDVQRLVVSAYAHLPWARYLLLRVDNEATDGRAVRSWLGALPPTIATAAAKPDAVALNVAITADGLDRIGVSKATMATFPRGFRQGMRSERRARLLGDSGASAPDRWAWGGPGHTPHVLLAVYALTADGLEDAARGHVEDAGRAGLHVAHSIDSLFLPNGLEHFGFTDGISQPVLAGTEWADRTLAPARESIAPGEFVLGHRDEMGFVAQGPNANGVDLGMNGSYLVLRQLEQHVESFRSLGDDGAKLVGRRRDGQSLALGAPTSDPDKLNNFDYDQDEDGLGCPVGAHVRRANPRTAKSRSNRHRLIRRGRPYGPADEARTGDEPRGLVFIALNADLERQFEFVQHTWLNNATFGGLSDELDPITAEQPDGGGSFTIPARPARRRRADLPSFTTTRGGAYFFLPGLSALAHLAEGGC